MKMYKIVDQYVIGKSPAEIQSKGKKYIRKKVISQGAEIYYRQKLHTNKARRSERRTAAKNCLSGNDTILFLCHGNICRSPFAQLYANQKATKMGVGGIEFESAGYLPPSDPKCPQNAVETAKNWGLDLGQYYSIQVNTEDIDQADLILLMDYRNYHNIISQYPRYAEKTFFLRVFEQGRDIEIVDPYGDGPDGYKHTYKNIARSIDSFLEKISV